MKKILTRLFKLEKGEFSIVFFSLFHSFFTGVSQVFTGTAANTLFLSNFKAELLPFIYIMSSLIVPFIGIFIIRRGQGNSQKSVARTVLLFLAFIPALIIIFLLAFPKVTFFSLVLMIWVDIEIVLSDLIFWQVSNKVYNIRQAKRLFGLIGSGFMVAYIVSGLLIPIIVRYIDIPLLLIVSIAGQLLSLFILLKLLKRNSRREKEIPQKNKPVSIPLKSILKEKYFRSIFLMVGSGYLVYYFIDLFFYQAGQSLLSPGREMASFLGLFWSVVGIGNLILRTFFYSRWVSASGITGGLLAGPVIIGIGVLSALIISTIYPGISLILIIIIIIKFSERVFINSFYVPSYFTLFQPLEDSIRNKLQNLTETVIGQGAGSIAGVLLFLIFSFFAFPPSILFLLLFIIVISWIFIIRVISREYRKSLAKTLRSNELKGRTISLSESNIDFLKTGLKNANPYIVKASLHILISNNIDIKKNEKIFLLQNSFEIIRREVCYLLISDPDSEMLPHLLNNFQLGKKDVCEFAEAIGSIVEEKSYAFLNQYVDSSDLALQDKVVFALLRYFPEREMSYLFKKKLHKLVISEDPADRLRAAYILPRLSADEFYPDIELLLNDSESNVQLQALFSLVPETIFSHIKTLLLLSSISGLDSLIINIIAETGSGIIGKLEDLYMEHHENAVFRKEIIIRIYGKMGDESNQYLLCAKLDETNFILRNELLNALQSCSYKAQNYDIALLQRILADEKGYCRRLFSSIKLLNQQSDNLLADAFQYEISKSIGRIFITLSFIYPSEEIFLILNNLLAKDPEKRAYALELTDTILKKSDKRDLFPILEESNKKRELAKSNVSKSAVSVSGRKSLIEGVKKGLWNNLWIKNCGLFLDNKKEALDLIRIVQMLKNTELFSEIPEEKLAGLAPIVKELEFSPKSSIIIKDDLGFSMFILAAGKVRVHDGEKGLAEINVGGFFGEFSVLSPEPRSASITSITGVKLLEIEQRIFLNFLQSNPEAGRAIITVLCHRIRKRSDNDKNVDNEKESLKEQKVIEIDFIEKYLILKSMQLFSDIPESFVIEAAERIFIRLIEKDQILYGTGWNSTSLYMVIDGEFTEEENGNTIRNLSSNSIIGELSALDSKKRENTIRAVSESRVIEISQRILLDLMWNRNELINSFLQILISRLRNINKK